MALPNWITLSATSGTSGTSTVVLTVSGNTDTSARTASFVVETADETIQRTVTISQAGGSTPPSPEAGGELQMTILSAGTVEWLLVDTSEDAKTIEYKKNDGDWTQVTSIQGGASISVAPGDVLKFRGNNNEYVGSRFNNSNGVRFNLSGNINSMLSPINFSGITSLGTDECFRGLFARTGVVNASSLALSATTLSQYCYESLFSGCTSLTTPPTLPATTMKRGCYEAMFSGCTSLQNVSSTYLPATTLANRCYLSMFAGCTSITSAPNLPAARTEMECYKYMFWGCTNLASVPSKSTVTVQYGDYAFAYMFANCTSLTGVPSNYLNFATLAGGVYEGMFYNCTGLTSVPTLPSYSAQVECYKRMFDGCSSLTAVTSMSLMSMMASSCELMYRGTGISNVPNNYLPATVLAERCYYGMFQNCKSLTSAPNLPATTMKSSCYEGMFYGCTNLANTPSLPATTLAENCYNSMFYGCGISTAPSLPATTLANSCYYAMFMNCAGLTYAPVLSASTLVSRCYYGMFNGCSNLNYIRCLATDISASNCTTSWVNGVASSGLFVEANPNVGWTRGNNGIPVNWNVQDEGVNPPAPDSGITSYLTFVAMHANIALLLGADPGYQGKQVKVSWDSGSTWTTYSSTTGGTLLASLSPGESVMVKGDNNNYIGNYFLTTSQSGWFNLQGNIMSLISSSNFSGLTSISYTEAFQGLFSGCYIKDASALRLPATTLSTGCYSYLFDGCTMLTAPPELPATTMAKSCYAYMFKGCSGLTSAPALPSETLAENCYEYMFSGCTSLTTSPILPAETLVKECYKGLFYGCENMNKIYCLALYRSATDCTLDFSRGVAYSGTFYEHFNASGWAQGTNGIPAGWTLSTYTP